MSRPMLELRGLSVRTAHGLTLVDQVSLCVPKGGSTCIIGETGSGKSLVAQAVMGLLPHGLSGDGTITLAGRLARADDVLALRGLWHSSVSLIPQEPGSALDPLIRVANQLGRQPAHALAALAEVDLPADTARLYPFQLSGGMAQRVLVANARLTDASLIIADEPTKGLDPPRVKQVIALLRALRDAGKTLLVITHDLAVARGLADGGHVAVMKDAAIVESGPPEVVLREPRHAYTRAWLAADPANWPACETCLHADDLVLAAHDLTFGYRPGAPLFEGLHIHVRRGEVLAVTGPSGKGKSTLGNVLLGLQKPTRGEVSWAGCDPYLDLTGGRRLRRRYQKLHQDPTTVFTPYRTLGDQLDDVGPGSLQKPHRANLQPLLERLKLRPALLHRRIGEVSGGEAQRLALARLLLMNPSLIVADEPTSRLDPIVQREAMLLLRDLVMERGLALILISHHADLVKAVSDTVLDMATDSHECVSLASKRECAKRAHRPPVQQR
jgi:peptide/nickel transport system ATP-binding protein